jgi:peptidyl-dipeptidase A
MTPVPERPPEPATEDLRGLPEAGRAARLEAFVARYVAEVEPLSRRHLEEVWLANVSGKREHEDESARLEARLRLIHARRDAFAFLRDLEAAGGVSDALLQRQLVLLHHAHRAQQIAPERIERMVRLEKLLESRFNNFRAQLDGQRVADNALREVLRSSDDAALRRRAWDASKQIGAEVEPDLLSLVGERNEAAREVGFPDAYAMMLTLDELDEAALFASLDEVERGTRGPFEAYKRDLDARLARRFGIGPGDLRPWHYVDPFFQEAPAAEVSLDPWFADLALEDVTRRFFAAVGLDLADVLRRSDLHEREGKCPHAFCISVDRGDDVRVLCNLRPNEHWMSTLLHECGHAAYDLRVGRDLPWVLRGPAHILSTEASAMLFGRLSKNAAWLTRWAGVAADEARAASAACARATRDQLLVQTRWMLVMCHMERALYRDPRQDLRALWWDLVERFQGVRRPEGREAPDWASKIHFSVAPVYYHNYLLGEMMASQLQRHLLEHVLGGGPGAWERLVESPAVGEALTRDLYASGRRHDWRGTLRRATGRALEPAAFVAELADGR